MNTDSRNIFTETSLKELWLKVNYSIPILSNLYSHQED